MKFDSPTDCAHPVVAALDAPAQHVYLALLRGSDSWGELSRSDAVQIANRTLRVTGMDTVATARGAFEVLHQSRLIDVAGDGVCVWTPRQREDAAVFAAPLDWIEGVKS
jgi:hypothetical protein